MGLVHVSMGIANPAVPQKVVRRKLLIDSGAIFSVAPSPVLRRLGIERDGKRSFTLANGNVISREVGTALFWYKRHRAGAPIIFGQPGDADIVGVVTLEALGLALDPLKRELRPMPMPLM